MITIDDFNWVQARTECELNIVFEKLKLEIEGDIKTRNASLGKEVFKLIANDQMFAVRDSRVVGRGMNFEIRDDAIMVKDGRQLIIKQATLNLNDIGQCRLKVKDEEREFWQFRKDCLEELFFTNP